MVSSGRGKRAGSFAAVCHQDAAIVCEIHYPCKSMSNETIVSLFIKGKKSNPENAEKAVKKSVTFDNIATRTNVVGHKNY